MSVVGRFLMMRQLFLAHPHSVGESYWQHARIAGSFGWKMLVAGCACLLHAAFPALFPRTASDAVKQLYGQMKARQPAFAHRRSAFQEPSWQPEYEI